MDAEIGDKVIVLESDEGMTGDVGTITSIFDAQQADGKMLTLYAIEFVDENGKYVYDEALPRWAFKLLNVYKSESD